MEFSAVSTEVAPMTFSVLQQTSVASSQGGGEGGMMASSQGWGEGGRVASSQPAREGPDAGSQGSYSPVITALEITPRDPRTDFQRADLRVNNLEK